MISYFGAAMLSLAMIIIGYLAGSYGKGKLKRERDAAEKNSHECESKNLLLYSDLSERDQDVEKANKASEQNASEAQRAREDYANALTKIKLLEDRLKDAEEQPKVDDAEVTRQIDAANKANADLAEQIALNDKMAAKMDGMNSELKSATQKIKTFQSADAAQVLKELELFKARWAQTSGNWRKTINRKMKAAAAE